MSSAKPPKPKKSRRQPPLTVVDLFSGAGGFSLGFMNAKNSDGEPLFEIRLLVDADKEAAFTFKSNYPETPFLVRDIRNVSADDIRAYAKTSCPDVVVGGPPCQGFSQVGKRLFEDERNQLLKDFVRLVSELKPKIALMENVPSLLGMHGAYAEEIEQQLSEAGYESRASVLQMSDYGIPQIRRRAFFFAVRKDLGWNPTFPLPLPENTPRISAEEAIGDLPPLKSGEGQDPRMYPNLATSNYQKARRGSSFLLFNHVARKHAAWFLEKISVIPEGGGNNTLEPDLQFSDNYFSQAYARLTRDKPAYTITTNFLNPGSGRFIHYRDRRSITAREAARFQSFDDNYIFHGTSVALERHIGNAVPPLMSLAWARHIAVCVCGPIAGKIEATKRSTVRV